MTTLSYSQLEGLWIQAGGDPAVASLMASIALAESSGNPASMNYTDNNGTQTSVGLWQVSSGNHRYPANWTSALGNAQEAVVKYKTQGLKAWGTYDTGAYKKYYQGGSTIPDTGVDATLSPYDPTTNVTATISPQELAQQYGYAYSMFQAIPELKNLFNQAVAGQWDATRFQAALLNTSWYKQHSASQRAWIAEGYTDPSTQKAQLNSQIASVQAMAAKFGANLSTAQLRMLATDYLANGWNSDNLQRAMSGYIKYDANGALGGSSGDDEMTLRSLASENGVNISNNWILSVAQHIANDATSIEDAEGYIRQQAEKLFPSYSKEIAAGQNMSDLAAPYVQDYEKILEVGPGQTNLFDPTMVKALQYKDNTGQNTTMPLWQFDQTLRNDPRWGKTQNAQDTTMGVGRQILQSFGFSF